MQAWQPDASCPVRGARARVPGRLRRARARHAGAPAARRRGAPRGAALFMHGFCDYFFQRHLAERFAMEGYAFYTRSTCASTGARCARTSTSSARMSPSTTRRSRSIDVIGEPVLLAGHSTGGLIASLYAHEGPHREQVRALCSTTAILRLEPADWRRASCTWPRRSGASFPFLNDPGAAAGPTAERCSTRAGSSTPRSSRCPGFRCTTAGSAPSPTRTPRCTPGWTRCPCWRCIPTRPTSCSTGGTSRAGRARARRPDIAVMAFPGAMHDVTLSRREIRDEVFLLAFFLGRTSRDVAGVVFPRQCSGGAQICAAAPRKCPLPRRGIVKADTEIKLKWGGWGLAAGAVGAMIAEAVGGWTTQSKMQQMTDAAVLNTRVAICVAQFTKEAIEAAEGAQGDQYLGEGRLRRKRRLGQDARGRKSQRYRGAPLRRRPRLAAAENLARGSTDGAGWHPPKRQQRRERPAGIGGREHPFRRRVVEEVAHPAADERLGLHQAFC